MQEHTTIPFPHPQLTAADPLTEVLRRGAQRLLAQAVEAEVEMLLARARSQGRRVNRQHNVPTTGTRPRCLAPGSRWVVGNRRTANRVRAHRQLPVLSRKQSPTAPEGIWGTAAHPAITWLPDGATM
jgi:hypothetical protein